MAKSKTIIVVWLMDHTKNHEVYLII